MVIINFKGEVGLVNAFTASREKIHGASSVGVRYVLAARYDCVVKASNMQRACAIFN
jgi:hypothetical protein